MSDALTLAALWVPFTLLAAWVITRSRRHKHACPLCDGTGILREDPTTRRLNNAEAARHAEHEARINAWVDETVRRFEEMS